MTSLFLIISIISGVLLTLLVLIQKTNTDAGGSFSSDSMSGYLRRGAEKSIYNLTILVAIIFAVSLFIEGFIIR
ncbi:MAG: preprotein translocase subunit SecG [Cyanobium sp. MAG06]|nr:preprotein translocase subunit SecG [Cyanobium sp. MAG06]